MTKQISGFKRLRKHRSTVFSRLGSRSRHARQERGLVVPAPALLASVANELSMRIPLAVLL
ncbi:MAG: hypothetical protein FD138_343, partial [Planctomycetota bacterium]